MKIKQLGKDLTTKTIGLPAWLFVVIGIVVLAVEVTDFIKGRVGARLYDWPTLWTGIVIFILFAVMWPYLIIHQDKETENKNKGEK